MKAICLDSQPCWCTESIREGVSVTDVIVMKGITKTFGEKVAVEELNLAVPQGAIYGLIGPNGAGKTTAIRMIMSILFPDKGKLSVLGKTSAVQSKDQIGYLPEERGVYKKMKVGSFLKHMGRLKGMKGSEVESKVKGWLERVELGDCYKKRCDELSKGMQQKVQFIASVLHEPELIILDEPFSGLDPVNMRLLRDLFLEQHKAGKTLIFSTHVMFQAEQLCEHIVMMNNGRKVLDASFADIQARHDPKVIAFEPVGGLSGDAIETIEGIDSVEKIGSQYEAAIRHGADTVGLVQQIVARIPVARIEIRKPTLEDIFIEIVEHDVADSDERDRLRSSLGGDGSGRAMAHAGTASGEGQV